MKRRGCGAPAARRSTSGAGRPGRARCRASRRSSPAPSARSPRHSAGGVARSAANTVDQSSRPCSSSASATQSSKAQFMPWPWNGTIACAASPSSSTRPPTCQRSQCTVPSRPCGLAANCAARSRHQRQRVGEVAREERAHRRGVAQRREAGRARARQEQRDGEGAVGVRQRDQHEAAARPDVQRVRLEREAAVRARRDRQFLVAVVEQRPRWRAAGRPRPAPGARRSRRRRRRWSAARAGRSPRR